MKIDILTLFPEMFEGFKNESIIKRAIEEKKVEINTCNFRDFAKNKHRQNWLILAKKCQESK